MKSERTYLVLITAICLPLAISAPTFAGSEIKLQGTVSLDAEACAKGTSGPDCRLNFAITGKAAKAIYDGMTEKGVLQECTGEVEKADASGMHCIKGKTTNDYYCDFAYYFKKDEFGGGGDGC